MSKRSIYSFGPEDRSIEGKAVGAIINDRLCIPILKELYLINDGNYKTNLEISNNLSTKINLESPDLQAHGNGSEFEYRLKWALNHLKNALLIDKNRDKNLSWKINEEGLKFLKLHKIDNTNDFEFSEYENIFKVLKDKFKYNNRIDKNKFIDLLNLLKDKFKNENNRFSIIEGKTGNHYAWIGDNNVIGNTIAHYEIGTRFNNKDIIKVDIHFEGKKNEKEAFFYQIGNDLPDNLNWFTWQKSKSIEHDEDFDIDDENVVDNLYDALLDLDEKLGDKVREIIKQINKTDDLSKNMKSNLQLNQILYGPPGTGKTYNTINKALSIIENKSEEVIELEDRKVIKKRFDEYLKSGQIVFTTFHQSMSYEDFIEGIKPLIDEGEEENKQVLYDVVDGLFKQIVERAKKERTESKEVIEDYVFEDAWNDLVEDAKSNLEQNSPLQLSIQTPNLGLKVVEITEKGNLKLKPIYSEQAKEYLVSFDRAKKLQNVFSDLSVVKNIDKEFRAVIGGSNSTAYWSVLNYINNRIDSNKKTIITETKAEKVPHVIIIDEINRGNVSQIFGELITLIEESKRLGNEEALEVTLPYSKEKFGVPSNLYIIGTMNTADRSVEALDTALRRRFSFVEMMPNYVVLKDKSVEGISLATLLKTINRRVEVLLDRDHTIGHSYFINVNSLEELKDTFKNNIIPLLQEYFYNDYGKIGLVLGKGFVREKMIENAKITTSIFADFSTKNEVDLFTTYELIPFQEVDFENALATLLT